MAKTIPKPQTIKPVVRVNMPAQAATVTSLAADVAEIKLAVVDLIQTVDWLVELQQSGGGLDANVAAYYFSSRKDAFNYIVANNMVNISTQWNNRWLKT